MLCSMRDIIDRYKKCPDGVKSGTSSDVRPFPHSPNFSYTTLDCLYCGMGLFILPSCDEKTLCNLAVHGSGGGEVAGAVGAIAKLSEVFLSASHAVSLHSLLSAVNWVQPTLSAVNVSSKVLSDYEFTTSGRHMLGEDLSLLKVKDLLQLEQELDLGATRVRARKAST